MTYYLERGQLPDEVEQYKNHRRLYQSVLVLAPSAAFEGFEKLCQKRVFGHEGRVNADITKGVTLDSLHKPKRTLVEKASIQKAKNEARRKLRKKKKLLAGQSIRMDQTDEFCFIAGYTSGGVPYGVAGEQLGMKFDESD